MAASSAGPFEWRGAHSQETPQAPRRAWQQSAAAQAKWCYVFFGWG